jgi:hypothetical protein
VNVEPTTAAATCKPRRCWLRFSLRTMLVLVAGVCVWLGIICRNAARQKRTVELIKAAGGSFAYFSGDSHYRFTTDPDAPRGFGWLRSLAGIDIFETVGIVNLGPSSPPTTRRAIDSIGDLPHLQALGIGSADITEDEMAKIESLPLRDLNLFCCKVPPTGWKSISRISTLETLGLEGENIDDTVLANVERLSSITTLELIRAGLTDAGIMSLKNMPHLHAIALILNRRLTAGGIANLQKAMPGVKIVSRLK